MSYLVHMTLQHKTFQNKDVSSYDAFACLSLCFNVLNKIKGSAHAVGRVSHGWYCKRRPGNKHNPAVEVPCRFGGEALAEGHDYNKQGAWKLKLLKLDPAAQRIQSIILRVLR